MMTKRPRTPDEYGMTICGILEHRADPQLTVNGLRLIYERIKK